MSSSIPPSSSGGCTGTGVLELVTVNERGVLLGLSTVFLTSSTRTSESVDSVGKGIDGISVVERLGTEDLEEISAVLNRVAVVNVGIRLHNPDELLARVVEVELDLVGGGTDRFVTSELKLLNQVLVGLLCHPAAFIRVKEHVVDIQGSSNKGLLVRSRELGGGTKGR